MFLKHDTKISKKDENKINHETNNWNIKCNICCSIINKKHPDSEIIQNVEKRNQQLQTQTKSIQNWCLQNGFENEDENDGVEVAVKF